MLFLSWQHKLSVYVFICLHCLLPKAATRVVMFVRRGVLKNSVNLTGNHLCWSLFLKNLLAWHLFWRTSVNDCFCTVLAPLAVTYPFYFIFSTYRSSHCRCSVKKVFLEISQKACNFIKKETLAQVLSCEFCEISSNMFSTEPAAEHLQGTASSPSSSLSLLLLLIYPMFVFRSNSKGFKEYESGISFLLSHFHRFYFLFPCFFCLSQFCFIFSCRC